MKQFLNRRIYMLYAVSILTIAGFTSCGKQDYDSGFVKAGEVYFLNESVLNTDLGVKVKGEPINWTSANNGRIKAPEGEATFVFYNKRTGGELAERTVNIIAGSPETYLIFQPTADLSLAFLDPNGQEGEEAAPEGYLKLKIANLSQIAIPDETIDLVVHSTIVNPITFAPIDTIEAIGRSLEDAEYFLIKKGLWNGQVQARYKFSFMNHNTKEPLLNAGETLYLPTSELNTNSNPAPKGIYTLYWSDISGPSSPLRLLRDGQYWDIGTNVLFAN